MSLGLRIRTLRKEKGMTQVQLAAKAGVSQPTVSSYELDQVTEWRAEILFRLAAALETTPEYLAKGIGPTHIADAPVDRSELEATIQLLGEDQQAILLSVAKSMLKV